ncbi:AAA family ATPase [Aureimonas leprariae]|uniref:AAA family ATPase n=1 Tax=Plantimonas leprariae TaxID=2615207 RepID=A0A7V7PSU8_9HYPH|nr:CpaE family protein [Aureimonas leprariae]KAB0682704.1 AAA family ATPase [Aureimonas leprariae]
MSDAMKGADTSLLHDESASVDGLRPIPRVSVQAFCETEGVAKPIQRASEDRRMAKAHLRVHMGGIRAAVEHYGSAPTPNLIILESRLPPDGLAAELEGLADVCDPGSKVVVIGHHNDIGLYRDLTRRGISEYLVAPVTMPEVMAVIAGLFADPDAAPLGRTIAFVGAKGGVGASTVAHNVAWSISRLFSSDVLLADLDLPFGTANINFDQDPAQGIAEAVFSADRLDEVFLDRLLARCADHLSLLAAPSLLDRTYDFGAEAFTALIETAQRTTPVVVLDVPHSWNDWTRSVLAKVDEVAIVAAPDLANLRNAKNLVDTLRRLRPNDRPPRLVLNQLSIPKRPEIAAADFAAPLELEPAGLVAFDPAAFGNAANNGRMIGEVDGKHPAVEVFNTLAHAFTGRNEAKRAKRPGLDLFARLRRK